MKQNRWAAKLTIPGKSATNFIYDHYNRLGYVSNKGQSVYVVDLGSKEIDVVNKITTELKPPLSGLHGVHKGERKLLFVSNYTDGKIKIFTSKNFADKQSKIKVIFEIDGAPECKILSYKHSRHEIWTGHSKGAVRVLQGVVIDFSKIKPRD